MEQILKDQEMQDRIRVLIVERLQVDEAEITPLSNLRDDLGADSLDMVELVMELEEEYGIEIADDEGDKLKTVRDTMLLVERKVKKS